MQWDSIEINRKFYTLVKIKKKLPVYRKGGNFSKIKRESSEKYYRILANQSTPIMVNMILSTIAKLMLLLWVAISHLYYIGF